MSFTYTVPPLFKTTAGSSVQVEPVGYAAGAGLQDIRCRNLTVTGTAVFSGTVSASTFRAGDGLEATPAFSFTNDTDCGLYRIGANSIGFSVGGTLRVTFNTPDLTSTVPFLGPNGTNGAPSFSFASDPDTGVYRAGDNQLGLAAGGNLSVTVEIANVSFNVQATFGTTAVFAAGGVGTPSLTFAGDLDTGFYSDAGNTIKATLGGAMVVTFDTTSVNLAAGKVYRIADTQVVKARIGGWGAWTGAASRIARDTGAATLSDCAQAIKALLDDLGLSGSDNTSHGLIGV